MSIRSALVDVLHDRSRFDFMGRRRTFLVISLVVLVASLGSLAIRGLDLGIDFEGGTSWQVEVEGGDPDVAEVRDILASLGEGNAKISVLGGDSIRVQSITTERAEVEEVTEALAGYAGAETSQVSIQTVGPTFGEEITEKAVRALLVFLVAVLVYLAFRFELKMALAAMAALAHDVGLTVGVYSLTGFEVTPATVIAILTILGYSLYDTVVVFDKVRDHVDTLNTSGSRTYGDAVNRSLNEVLMRSLNTSITTLLPVASLLVIGSWVLGAVSIRDFALALFVGLLAGTYSSIFTAPPVLVALKEREPRYRALRERVEGRRTSAGVRLERPPEGASRRAGAAEPAGAADARATPDAADTADTAETGDTAEVAGTAERSDDGEDTDEDVDEDIGEDIGEDAEAELTTGSGRSAARPDALDPDAVVRPRPRKQRRRKRRR